MVLKSTTFSAQDPLVYIIILNWNGWKDTIECLESVFRSSYSNYKVVVCDNNSSDLSLEKIKAWAQGNIEVDVSINSKISHNLFPYIGKPIKYVEYNREQAEMGGAFNEVEPSLILIQTQANLGFAGGNNIGIRYALARGEFQYIWLLNNDTVIEKTTLACLIKQALHYREQQDRVGIIGAKLLYYHAPDVIQGVGGVYSKWFAVGKHYGALEVDKGQYDNDKVRKKIDYPIGASMFVAADFLAEVGLMCEDYFLYYEEMDWMIRGKRKNWKLGYCYSAKIYHKEGASISPGECVNKGSKTADIYGLRNRIVFTRKFYPQYMVVVKMGLVITVLNRLKRKQFDRIGLVFRILFGKTLDK